jgi:hypothetical protein
VITVKIIHWFRLVRVSWLWFQNWNLRPSLRPLRLCERRRSVLACQDQEFAGPRYLSYMQIAFVLGAVVLLLVPAHAAINRWRSRNELKIAALLLSLDASQQRETLDELPDESRQRIMKLMEQMAHDRTRGHDVRDL